MGVERKSARRFGFALHGAKDFSFAQRGCGAYLHATRIMSFPRIVLLLALVGTSALAAEPIPVHLATNLEPRMGRTAVFAVDGDDATYFASRRAPKADEYFAVTLDAPALVARLSVATGKSDGSERLADGALEISEDGNAFTEIARLKDGTADAAVPPRAIKAIRVRVLKDGTEPFTLRELRVSDAPFAPAGVVKNTRQLGSEFGGATISFLGDATLLAGDEQTKLTAFLEKAGAIYVGQLAEMARRLDTPWERVPKSLVVTYKAETGKGVPAYASGNTITLNTAWVLRDPADSVGMFTHELSHVVQQYRPGNPGWLVEGLADLIRYELSPPSDAWVQRLERIDPKRSDYKHAYSEAAKFLAWVQKSYAPGLEGKLSRPMHDGKFRDELWAEITGKDLAALWSEYQGG
jgi:hypothetical protein